MLRVFRVLIVLYSGPAHLTPPTFLLPSSFLFQCAVLENMIKRWYDPKYEGKVYPGDASSQKCNEPGWPTKNFAISAALVSNANLFASNMCANTTLAGDKQQQQQQQQVQEQEQEEKPKGGDAEKTAGVGEGQKKFAKKMGFPHPLWSNNPSAPVGNKWDGKPITASISEADPSQVDKGDTSRILV